MVKRSFDEKAFAVVPCGFAACPSHLFLIYSDSKGKLETACSLYVNCLCSVMKPQK